MGMLASQAGEPPRIVDIPGWIEDTATAWQLYLQVAWRASE